MSKFGIDIASAFDRVEKTINFEYRDPLMPPYGSEEKITEPQRKAWAFLKKWGGYGPLIGMVAAKGASKTHFGGCFAWHQMQMYPESVGCLVSNTFGQAKDNGLPVFLKIGKILGFEDVEYFDRKKIRGKPYTSVVVVRLADNVYAYLLIRSYDAIQNFEGVEIDWVWSEEGQDATYEQFSVPFSRNRGQYADNAFFYAAMPDDESHYQYTKLPLLGFTEEDKFVEPAYEDVVASHATADPIEVGILYEFSVYENRHNVGEQYIKRNSNLYSGAMYDRYILGQRGSSKSSRIYTSFARARHVDGFAPHFLSGLDESRDATLILDFNVAPACATLWQSKPWNDKWEEECFIHPDTGQLMRIVVDGDDEKSEPLSDITLVAAADREMHVQVGEFECWEGGTRGIMAMIVERLKDFNGLLYVNGDATGNSMRSSATVTDWDIVRDFLDTSGIDFELQPGLIANLNESTGKMSYSNPSRGDTINLLNLLLRDNGGHTHMVLLPKSEYDSGGLAASIAAMKTKPDGSFDESCDKKEGRDVPRTHFQDTARYYAWWATGGSIFTLTDHFDDSIADLRIGRAHSKVQEQYGLRRDFPRLEDRIQEKTAVRSGSRGRTTRHF